MKKIKKFVLVLLILFAIFFVLTEICILYHLKKYGYGVKELPKTTLVYFGLSDGFTVEDHNSYSFFIGDHDYIYDKVFEKKGYYEYDQMGITCFYRKKDKKYSENGYEFTCDMTDDWCHWFRVYRLSGHSPIEDF